MLVLKGSRFCVLAGAVKSESHDAVVAVPLRERGAPEVVFEVEVHPARHLGLHVVVTKQPCPGRCVVRPRADKRGVERLYPEHIHGTTGPDKCDDVINT